jgi:hypothetical protein
MSTRFSKDDIVSGGWMKFNKVGDELEGTLVGKRMQPNNFKRGADQTVYEIMDDDGTIWNVARSTAQFDMDMKMIKIGQYVNLKFEREKPSDYPDHPTKIIVVRAKKDLFNEKWLKEKAEQEVIDGDNVSPNTTVPILDTLIDTPVEKSPFQDGANLEKIKELATKLFGVTELESIKATVMEKTRIAFIETNFPDIIDALNKMVK